MTEAPPEHSPADLAAAIVLLAAPSNRLMSGAVVPVYGRS